VKGVLIAIPLRKGFNAIPNTSKYLDRGEPFSPGSIFFFDRPRKSTMNFFFFVPPTVAFRIYDIDQDGFISNGELFQVLKTMVGSNLTDKQLQEIVDKTILYADKDGDGKISFDEFCEVSPTCI